MTKPIGHLHGIILVILVFFYDKIDRWIDYILGQN